MIQGWLAIRRRESWRGLVAASCAVAAISGGPSGAWSEEATGSVALHLAMLSVMALGAIFDDELGRQLRVLGSIMLGVAAAAVMAGDPHPLACLPPGSDRVYPLLMAAVAAGYGYACGGRPYYLVSGAILGGVLAVMGSRGYLLVRQRVVGLDRIAWGLASFLVAAAISLWKAGLPKRWWARWRATRCEPSPPTP
jgi:hypothetical protein